MQIFGVFARHILVHEHVESRVSFRVFLECDSWIFKNLRFKSYGVKKQISSSPRAIFAHFQHQQKARAT